MAVCTTRGDAGVVHRSAGKTGSGLMTGLTGRRSGDVGTWLALRSGTVMAVRTAGSDTGMIHRCAALEADGGLVTGFAGRRGGDVRAWFRHRLHTLEAGTVMASRTTRGDADVVHRGAGKACSGFVASRTACGCRNMVSGLTLRSRTVMAVRTTCSDTGVIHRTGREGGGRFVTGLAGRRSSDMGA